jgi:hypothetical protein
MSSGFNPTGLRDRLRLVCRFTSAICLLVFTLTQAGEVTRSSELERLTHRQREARSRFEGAPTDLAAALVFSRACFELAEFATNSMQRAALATVGIAASRQVLTLDPTNAAAHCALGLNLGQLARTKTLGALKIVPQIEAAWLDAARYDPKYNHAAPHRLLALLYEGAPGWPISVGSRSAARTNFLKAVQLAPDYADNWLSYLEVCLDWNDLKTARTLIPKAASAMAVARQKFTAPEWAWELQDWERRWTAAQKRLDAAERRARSTPHHQRMKDD